MAIIEEVPAFPQEEAPKKEQDISIEDWYADVYKKFGLTKEYLEEAYKESIRDTEELYKLLEEAGSDDFLDLDIPVEVPVFHGLHSIRNADIIEDKLYLDEEKQVLRYSYLSKYEGNSRNEATILLNQNDNRLSDIITQLPYGLIDKQATGIGATHLELHYSQRNSIIVVPTRALGENKCAKDPDNFLYVGTKSVVNKVTSDNDIKKYLNDPTKGIEKIADPTVKFKKIVVVANSLWRVIKALEAINVDVYREYYLMIDEVDSIQLDNHFRPELSDVIDYYHKFKLQRRALVSATVKEFSDPELKSEPLTTIKRSEPKRRDITLLHTNNINKLLSIEIERISKGNPLDKILIAYNSVTDILEVISKLSDDIKSKCGVLCSEMSYDKVGSSLQASIDNEDKLSHDIVFMTCAYFAGIDIKDRCHLITVSSKRYGYTLLPLNKITQIHGRCRSGIRSDIIIYNTLKEPFKYWNNYKESLIFKATNVIELLDAANNIKRKSENLQEVFNRIEPVIIREAGEVFFSNNVIPLTRKTIDDKKVVSYFNIDYLYEQMATLSLLYSHVDSLKNQLKKEGHTINLGSKEVIFEEDENTNNSNKYSDEVIRMKVQNCINDIAHTSPLNDEVLDYKISHSKDIERRYYERFKELYRYIERGKLNEKLLDICTEDKRAYRSFKNAVCFWALEDNHPFKLLIKSYFLEGEKYSSQEIGVAISDIIKDQLFIIKKYGNKTYTNFFTSLLDWSHTQNKYRIRGYTPKQLRELGVTNPLITISFDEPITKYIEFM